MLVEWTAYSTWISVVVTRVKHEALLKYFSVLAPGSFASLGLYLDSRNGCSGASHSVSDRN